MPQDLAKLNVLTSKVIAAAVHVHRELGPGLLESVYCACLAYELRKDGLPLVIGRPVPVRYDGVQLDCAFRLDMVAADHVVLEIKSVRQLAPIHMAQLLTYLRL